MEKKQKPRKLLKKLKNRYRLLIINETNFQEKTSISLTYGNILLIASAGLLLFSIISWGIFTLFPTVKDYAPGYSQTFDGKMKNDMLKKMSALEKKILIAEKRELALKQIFSGKDVTAYDIPFKAEKSRNVELEINETKAEGDRVENAKTIINNAKKDEISQPTSSNQQSPNLSNIETEADVLSTDFLFFSPIRGKVLSNFNYSLHPSVMVAPQGDNAIKAAMEGTVILSAWTPDNGYIISIQHPNNWISTYKQNAANYKNLGALVKAGETIAIVGNNAKNGNQNTLEFELWHNGIAVNPLNYIAF